jgi:hypothetical protein
MPDNLDIVGQEPLMDADAFYAGVRSPLLSENSKLDLIVEESQQGAAIVMPQSQ